MFTVCCPIQVHPSIELPQALLEWATDACKRSDERTISAVQMEMEAERLGVDWRPDPNADYYQFSFC